MLSGHLSKTSSARRAKEARHSPEGQAQFIAAPL